MLPFDPCLCLDGSVRGQFRTGLCVRGSWVATTTSPADPAAAVQPCVDEVLTTAGLKLHQLAAIAVNLGPGSILGIRTSLLSARAWSEMLAKPVLVWSGHTAAAWAAAGSCDAVVSEGRSGYLNLLRLNASGPVGELTEVTPDDILGLRLRPLHGGFRHASTLPLGEVVDAWQDLPSLVAQHDLLRISDRSDALNAPATYALWSGRRHQGGNA